LKNRKNNEKKTVKSEKKGKIKKKSEIFKKNNEK